MQIIPRIEEFYDDLVNWRHDIHAHPELGFEERRTSDLGKLCKSQRPVIMIEYVRGRIGAHGLGDEAADLGDGGV